MVFVVAVMYTVLANAPLIFLRLAEINEGEMDAIVRPGPVRDGSITHNRGYQYLNYTKSTKHLLSSFLVCIPSSFQQFVRLPLLSRLILPSF